MPLASRHRASYRRDAKRFILQKVVLLLESLHLRDFLSFGRDCLPVELGPLNVIIGANGAGKSNFIEAIDLMRAAPSNSIGPTPARLSAKAAECASGSGKAQRMIPGPASTQCLTIRAGKRIFAT